MKVTIDMRTLEVLTVEFDTNNEHDDKILRTLNHNERETIQEKICAEFITRTVKV